MKEKLKKIYHFSGTWTGTIIIVLIIIFFIIQAFVIPSGSMQRTLLIGDFLFAKKFSYGVPIPRLPFVNTPILPDIFNNGHIVEGSRPKRGDIVIFINPKNDKENYVKRCFATGGDEVIFVEKDFYLHHNEGDEYIKNNYNKNQIVSMLGKLWVRNPYIDKYPGIYYDSAEETMLKMIGWENNPFENNKLKMTKMKIDDLKPFKHALTTYRFEYQNEYRQKKIATVHIGDFNVFYTKINKDEFFMIGDNRDDSADSRFFGAVPYKLIVGKPWFIYFSWDEKRSPRWDRIGSFVSTVEKNINPKYLSN